MGIACLGNLTFVMVYGEYYSPTKVKSFGMFNLKLLQKEGVEEYLSISLPAMVMLCAEWWAMEVLILLAANLGTVAIGAMTISYNY